MGHEKTAYKALKQILKNRLLIFLILLLVLGVLSFYYTGNYFLNEEDPSAENFLLNNPEGQMVSFEGWVVEVYPGGFQLYIYHHGKDTLFDVNSNANVSVGDNVFVKGSLSDEKVILAKEIVLKQYWMYLFLLARSALALLIVIILLVRYWKFDLKNWEIVRRK
jgi:hypothetical protein